MKEWLDKIHRVVSAATILSMHGVELRYGGDKAEQIGCPFHGEDRRASAKYYPPGEHVDKVHCFKCAESWDCIDLWGRFRGEDNRTALKTISKQYGIPIPHLEDGEIQYTKVSELDKVLMMMENELRNRIHTIQFDQWVKISGIVDQQLYAHKIRNINDEELVRRFKGIVQKLGQLGREDPKT